MKGHIVLTSTGPKTWFTQQNKTIRIEKNNKVRVRVELREIALDTPHVVRWFEYQVVRNLTFHFLKFKHPQFSDTRLGEIITQSIVYDSINKAQKTYHSCVKLNFGRDHMNSINRMKSKFNEIHSNLSR